MAENKNKTGGIADYLLIVFVLVTAVLILAEIGGNVSNELEYQHAVVSTPQVQPTATATLTPEELQKILRENPLNN